MFASLKSPTKVMEAWYNHVNIAIVDHLYTFLSLHGWQVSFRGVYQINKKNSSWHFTNSRSNPFLYHYKLHIKMKAIHSLNLHTDNEISLLSPVSQLNSNNNHTQKHFGICSAMHLLNQITLINIQTLSIQLSTHLNFWHIANLDHPLLPLL